MKRSELEQIMIDYCEVEKFEDVLEGIIYEKFHNPIVCTKCEEVREVEPDCFTLTCPSCGGKCMSATHIGGIY